MKSKILFSASLFHGVNDAAAVTVPMVFPLLFSRQFLITRYADIGILSNLGMLTTLLFQIVIVFFAHRIEYRHMMLMSILGISASLILITRAGSFGCLLPLYLLMRAFLSFYHPMGTAMVARTHPDSGLDFAIGIQSGSGNLGVLLAFVSVGFIAQRFGWRTPILIWAGIGLAAGGICFLLVRDSRTREIEHQNPDWKLWLRSWRRIRVWVPGFVFGGSCWGTAVYYAPSLLNHRFRIGLGETGIYLAAWIGLGTLMPYLFGILAGRFGRSRIAAAGVFGASAFALLLGLSPSAAAAVPALLVFGAFLFLVFPALQSLVAGSTPPEEQTAAFSLAANLQMLSGALVILFSGFISDLLGIHAPFIFLGLLGAGVGLGFWARRIRNRPADPDHA